MKAITTAPDKILIKATAAVSKKHALDITTAVKTPT